MKKYLTLLPIALLALTAADCGGSRQEKPTLNSDNPQVRRQAVEAAAEKFGDHNNATENPGGNQP